MGAGLRGAVLERRSVPSKRKSRDRGRNAICSADDDVGLARARPIEEMASLPCASSGARFSRLLETALRSKSALSRRTHVIRWSYRATASSPTWSDVQNAVSDLQFYQRQQLQQRRSYASSSGRISHVELKEGVHNVFELFDKVRVEEASRKGWESMISVTFG